MADKKIADEIQGLNRSELDVLLHEINKLNAKLYVPPNDAVAQMIPHVASFLKLNDETLCKATEEVFRYRPGVWRQFR